MLEVVGQTNNRGIGARGPSGTVTVDWIIRSPELGRMEVPVTVPDHGDPSQNEQAARQMLASFAQALLDALQVPRG